MLFSKKIVCFLDSREKTFCCWRSSKTATGVVSAHVCTRSVLWPVWGHVCTRSVLWRVWGHVCTRSVLWPVWGQFTSARGVFCGQFGVSSRLHEECCVFQTYLILLFGLPLHVVSSKVKNIYTDQPICTFESDYIAHCTRIPFSFESLIKCVI